MRCAVVGEGREVLHECDSWGDAVEWFRRYAEREDAGGWGWFELRRDGRVVAKYAIDRRN